MGSKDLNDVLNDMGASGALEVSDIFPEVSKLLNREVLDGFIHKVTQTCLKFDDGRFYEVRLIGAKAKNREEGIKKLAEVLNAKYKEYKFLGTLIPAVGFELYGGEYMTASYILLNEEDCAKMDKELKEAA